MQRQVPGYLVTPALLTVPLPPLAQSPTKGPRRGCRWLGASAGHPSLLAAFRPGLRELGWVEGQNLAMALRSGRRRMRVPQKAYRLALGFDRHHAGTPAVHTLLCGSLATWMQSPPTTYGCVWAERVFGTRHGGRKDEASFRSMLEHLRAGTNAISLYVAVSPGKQPLTADERQGIGACAALTGCAGGGRLRELGMAVMTCSALDQRA